MVCVSIAGYWAAKRTELQGKLSCRANWKLAQTSSVAAVSTAHPCMCSDRGGIRRRSETYSARMPKLKVLERRYLLRSYLNGNFHGQRDSPCLEQNAP